MCAKRVAEAGPVIEFSVLDLSPILAGSDARQSLHNSRDLAQHA
jgi:hypothetical protein